MSAKPKPHHSTPQMPIGTRNFLEKLIDRQTASVDMTKHGFIHESHPMRLFLKPLRTQIQKIHGKCMCSARFGRFSTAITIGISSIFQGALYLSILF